MTHRRVSASFRHDEVEWLAQLLRTLLRGGDVRVLVRAKAMGTVSAKVEHMVRRLDLEPMDDDEGLDT